MEDHFNQLVAYIRSTLSQGYSEESIRQLLHQHQWPPEWVHHAFVAVNASAASTQPDSAQPGHQTVRAHQAPQKYRVFTAVADAIRVMRYNLGTFLLVTIVSDAISVALLFIVGRIINLIIGPFGLLFATTGKRFLVLMALLIMYSLWYVASSAFVYAAPSMVLQAAADKRKLSFREAFSETVARLSRILKATSLQTIIVYWPIAILILGPLLFASSIMQLLIIFVICGLLAIVWFYIASLRLALVPYVALFEPDVPVAKTLKRSSHLLMHGGQWFLVKGALLFAAISLIPGALTHQTLSELVTSDNIGVTIYMIIASVIINAVLVLLYRNRKVVKG